MNQMVTPEELLSRNTKLKIKKGKKITQEDKLKIDAVISYFNDYLVGSKSYVFEEQLLRIRVITKPTPRPLRCVIPTERVHPKIVRYLDDAKIGHLIKGEFFKAGWEIETIVNQASGKTSVALKSVKQFNIIYNTLYLIR